MACHAGGRKGGRHILTPLLLRLYSFSPPLSYSYAPEIFMTGHSLGGALATIASFDVHVHFGITPTMYEEEEREENGHD